MKFIAVMFFSACIAALSAQSDPALDVLMRDTMRSGEIPALAVLVIDSGLPAFRFEGGTVQAGSSKTVARGAAFHIGSDTKAMTALLAGMMVDEGKLRWDSTIGEVLAGKLAFRPEYKAVTLAMLLSHSAGLPGALPPAVWSTFFGKKPSFAAERKRMAQASLALAPLGAPGKAYSYSNLGYVVAGFMIETVTGRDWESLMRDRIFMPLGMKDSGFGPPAAPFGTTSILPGMPWGHGPAAMDPGAIGSDNPQALGPAGTVHASLDDLAAYAGLYFSGGLASDGKRLIKKETLDAIVKPVLSNYALGWISITWPEGERVLLHDGSNTMFYCSIVLVPEKKMAVIVMANSGTTKASKAVFNLREALVAKFSGY